MRKTPTEYISKSETGEREKSSEDPCKPRQDSGGPLRNSQEKNSVSRTWENGLGATAGNCVWNSASQNRGCMGCRHRGKGSGTTSDFLNGMLHCKPQANIPEKKI